jgi:probable phosphoglycerate mutase
VATTIHLVRHAARAGEEAVLAGQMPGIGLSGKGEAEAQWIADRLAGESLAAVLSSPLERAPATADIIAEERRCEVTVDPGLNEIDLGDWTGATFSDLADDPRWRMWNTARSLHRPPGGETMLEVQQRMVRVVESRRGTHPHGCLVLVSHAEPIRCLLLWALGLGIDQWARIEIATGSLSTLVVDDGGLRVDRINEAPR